MDGFKKSVFLLAIVTIATGLSTSLFSIYLNNLGISLTNIGLIFAVGLILASAIRLFLGTVVDDFGKKTLLSVSILGFSFFAFGLIFAKDVSHFIILKLFFDFSNVFFWTVYTAHFLDVIKKGKEGSGFGYRNSIFYAASAFAPVSAGLLANWLGFKLLFATSAIISLLGFVLAISIKEKVRVRKFDFKFVQKHFSEIFKVKGIKQIVFGVVLIDFLFTFWVIYMPIWLSQNGFSLNAIGALISGYILLSAILQNSIGKAIDKHSIKQIVFPGISLILLGGIFFFAAKQFISLLISRMALSVGGDMTYWPFCAKLARNAKKEIHGSASAFVFGLSGIFSGVAAVLGGWLVQRFGIQEVLIAAPFLSLLLIPLLFRRPQ